MIVQLLDDDVSIHAPWHFFGYLPRGSLVFGSSTQPDQCEFVATKFPHLRFIIKRRGSKLIQYLQSIFLLLRLFPKFRQISTIIVYDDLFKLIFAMLLFGRKKAVFRVTHFKYIEKFNPKWAQVYEDLIRVVCRLSVRIVLMSDSMIARLKIDGNVSVVESFVEDQDFRTQNVTDVRVIYAGTVSSTRSLSKALLQVEKFCSETGVVFRLYATGTAGAIAQTRSFVSSLNCEVEFVYGFTHDEYTNDLKLFRGVGLSPYLYELNEALYYNSPLKTLDYLAAGLAVVGSDIPSHKKLQLEDDKMIVCSNSRIFEALSNWFVNRPELDSSKSFSNFGERRLKKAWENILEP